MLTPFGVLVRKHRIDRSMKLLHMADALKVSPAFLSSVETGQKALPKGEFVDNIARILELNMEETEELHRAALASQKVVRFEMPEDLRKREVFAAFARKLPHLSNDVLDELQARLDKE